jgi:putative acetyltransferase
VRIRPERAADREAVRDVHTRAFGDAGLVADLAGALSAARAPLAPVSLVATVSDEDAGGEVVAGHVLISASRLDAPSRIVDVYVLSPLGVLPGFQRRGIGTALVGRAVTAAAGTAAPLLFLEGPPAYYGSRGFERAGVLGFRRPSLRIPPAAFQVARLPAYEPWMTGTLVYSDPFWALDCVGLRDEA